MPIKVIDNWQRVVNILADIINAPSAFIMKLENTDIEVFVTSQGPDNPLEMGYREQLIGAYCEKTIKEKTLHIVPNALKDDYYKFKPNLEKNKLIAYMGLPLEWPTGDIFGTICVVDREERDFNDSYRELLREFKRSVEDNLELIYNEQKLEEYIVSLEEAKEQIELQREHLELLNQVIRHDITNGIQTARLALVLLQEKQISLDDSGEIIRRALTAIDRSTDLLQKIETFEQMYSTEDNLSMIDVRELAEKVAVEFDGRVTVKGSCIVKADEFLELLLVELVRNSFKHTETDLVTIILDEADGYSRITVVDFGSGLPESVQNHFFGQSFTHQRISGLALGHLVMKRYNGHFTYEKGKDEEGSVFHLLIPKI